MVILIYFLVGFIIALVNNHLMSKFQTNDEKYSENPRMIIFLIFGILFWPFMIIPTIKLIIKSKHT